MMTFVVSYYGKVHERDLGDDTRHIAKNMNEYNLDDSWSMVND